MQNKLKEAIKAAGIGHTEFAARCGASLSTVSLWLKQSRDGSGRLPDGERAKEIELVLRVSDFRTLFPHDWPEASE
jgi:transcriptional regulator with XRE-family HTH domain